MGDRVVVGLVPWLPWPLNRWPWWTEPVRAERLAALRIGLSAILLLDVLFSYLPGVQDYFGRDSLGPASLFGYLTRAPKWWWSALSGVEDPSVLRSVMLVWVAALVCLLLGVGTRFSAIVVWVLSTSFATLNTAIDNGGDQVRAIILFYLMLCPCGAVWSIDARLRRLAGRQPGAVHVAPWAIRLLFVQMVIIYFCNGIWKATGEEWQQGSSVYYVLADLTLTRWSFAQFPVPYGLTVAMTWTVLWWEILFPLLVTLPWLLRGLGRLLFLPARATAWLETGGKAVQLATLGMGILFHVGLFASVEIGMFAPYMLCLYIPLFPWEKLADARARSPEPSAEPVDPSASTAPRESGVPVT